MLKNNNSSIMNFDNINSFKINNEKYLFFDIFHKNKEVILICPVYFKKCNIFNDIKIKYKNQYLKLKKCIKKIEQSEPIIILIYNFKSNDSINNLEVFYKNINKKYKLFNMKIHNSINKKLALTTLMKNDYNLINIFYNYYKKQGVQYFYIYYNGILSNKIKELYNIKNVKLIEWDYKYWNNKKYDFRHHAQIGQIHHSLYKYGKNNYNYFIFNDFDEYLYIPNKKLIDVVSNNKYDTIGFENHFCETLDNKTPNKFPETFYIGEKYKFRSRSKCIHKIDKIDTIGIHNGYKYNIKTPILKTNYILFHFFNWSTKNRKLNVKKLYSSFKVNVINFPIKECNGIYNFKNLNKCDNNTLSFFKDKNHQLYRYKGVWRLANLGKKLYFELEEYKNKKWDIKILNFNLLQKSIIQNVKKNGLTLLNIKSLTNLKDAILKTNNIKGILIEAGCGKGGSSIIISNYKKINKKFYLYDVFSTIPKPTQKDGIKANDRYLKIKTGNAGKSYYGYVKNLEDKIKKMYEKYNINIKNNNIYFVKGLYKNTMCIKEKVSFAHIDCDWYESVIICLKNIVPNLSIGGIIIIDDYNSWSGTNKAVDEYFTNIKNKFNFYFNNKKLHIQRKIK